MHINYELVEPWPDLDIEYSEIGILKISRVQRSKMRYVRNGKQTDKTTVIYNSQKTISRIPESAHDYKLGSRSAIDWILERYQIMTHKDSQIINNPNDWAEEHDNPTYIFDLLQRIITVSMRTNEIVDGLPKIKF